MSKIVDFTVIKSAQLQILAEDGTEFVLQVVPVRITRTDEILDNGEYKYEFQTQLYIDQRPPERKLVPEALKKDV